MLSAFTLLLLTASPEVALLSSSGSTGELRFQPIDAASPVAPVVRFSHAEGSPVLGTLLPSSRVVIATAVMKSEGDVSFASALLRLEAGRSARVLADQVVYGSRPLVTSEGRVFVSRGRAGNGRPDEARTKSADESAGRVDQLTVDEIDPRTAKTRTIHSTRGFFTFLVGALGREVVIYEVTPTGSRLIAVHADSLGVRVILENMKQLPAHDFVVDAPRKRVLFTQLTASPPNAVAPGGFGGSYAVREVINGELRTLATGPEITLLPAVRADGRVLISKGQGLGLLSLDGSEGLPAQGTGFERVSEREGFLIDLHERPSDFPSLLLFKGAQKYVVSTPADSRLDVAGVIP
ncbi:MAG: hypothetical protein JNM17_07900 [Archangium sp.]|nr:hypothetical protein [Archangium sp.]